MGLLAKGHEIRSKNVDMKVELTAPEAGLLLTAQVAFSDDVLTDEEAVAVRKYYSESTLKDLEKKLEAAGLDYPADLDKIKPSVESTLKSTDKLMKLRAVAAALDVAHADGVFDREEMIVLNHFCQLCEISLAEAELYRQESLMEIDEREDYSLSRKSIPYKEKIDLNGEEAALALSAWVAFSDDDPSNEEMAIIRDAFTAENLKSLDKKMEEGGFNYPEDLPLLASSILTSLGKLDRDLKVRHLATAYKTAAADGVMDKDELAILKKFTDAFCIGVGELNLK